MLPIADPSHSSKESANGDIKDVDQGTIQDATKNTEKENPDFRAQLKTIVSNDECVALQIFAVNLKINTIVCFAIALAVTLLRENNVKRIGPTFIAALCALRGSNDIIHDYGYYIPGELDYTAFFVDHVLITTSLAMTGYNFRDYLSAISNEERIEIMKKISKVLLGALLIGNIGASVHFPRTVAIMCHCTTVVALGCYAYNQKSTNSLTIASYLIPILVLLSSWMVIMSFLYTMSACFKG